MLEAVGVKTKNEAGRITVISAYLPANTSNQATEDIKKLFQWLEHLECEIIVGADLNANRSTWGPDFPECSRGKLVNQISMDSKLILLNDGSPTMCLAPRNRPSAIDLITQVRQNSQESKVGSIRRGVWERPPNHPDRNRR